MNQKIKFVDLVIKENPNLYIGIINRKFTNKINEISAIIGLRITIVDFKGNVIADSYYNAGRMDNHRYRIEIMDSLTNKIGESIRYSNTLQIDMLYIAQRLDKYIIRLSKPLNEIDETLNSLRNLILSVGVIIVIIAIITIFFISKRITDPISETRNFAEVFSEGDYTRRILNFSDDEIGILQRTLNKMADQIVNEMDNLRLEQNKLKLTIDSINDGIAVIDNRKRLVIANKAFLSLFNVKTEIINKIYYEVIRGSLINSKIEDSLSHCKDLKFQEEFKNKKFCDVFIIPIKEEKSMSGVLIVTHDITEKQKMDQLKTDLVGNLSHELKTPIAILKGYLETIEDNLDNADMCRDFISKALSNVNRQDSIINDMLKLNMLETMTDITTDKIDLKEIINNCIEILSSRSDSKNITVVCDIDIPERDILGNRFLVEEIFFNIIVNAINYTNPEGRIEIISEQRDNKIIISISDSGIGIPEVSIERIFERFYRVDKSRSRATGGTGLGLSIVKHAVEILGWGINVSSSSEGTIFYVEIS
ncbi:MAG: ATP-binding protein [Spirochaetota bacterium]|nr:ATP-binding protein [Spirochaetota bacterium]